MIVRVTILGSGTSTGVPMLGCTCAACRSTDPRDQRLRSSLLISVDGRNLVIDTTPEFRIQMLRANVSGLDAVMLTHSHADHIHGFDDLRAFTMGTDVRIPVYGASHTLAHIREHFRYIWESEQVGGGVPQVDLHAVDGPFEAAGLTIEPIPVWHGRLAVFGFRFADCAYISDVSAIPDSSMDRLRGLRLLIIDAVRYRPHSTHFHLEAAKRVARRLAPAKTVFTHLNHDFVHAELVDQLPADMDAAYDGMQFDL
ncbi:MAG: MBL fold metallo-hydrolase, partial [Verrucomicrobiota bacterium]